MGRELQVSVWPRGPLLEKENKVSKNQFGRPRIRMFLKYKNGVGDT